MAAELEELVASGISETIQIIDGIRLDDKIVSTIGKIAAICIEAIRDGNKIMFAANGGAE
jgi:phosphoheptose isomerase